MNDVTQTSGMDLYVRYWDVNVSQVNSRYYGSIFVGLVTHKDLSKHFGEITKDLSSSKWYHMSNFNPKYLNEVSKLRAVNSVHSLVDIGTWSLHSALDSMKTGEIAFNGGWRKLWNLRIPFFTIALNVEKTISLF